MAPKADLIGPYELERKLGSGGMGTVYRARDTRTGQIVALKVLRSELAEDEDYVRRFRREATIVKELDSPHIVPVLDYGQDGDQHYLAMEYVEGKSLAQVLRERGKLSPEEARTIATQIALALDAAHNKDIVHRDIKPGNILIASDGIAKVADFGIARAADSTTITKTGLFLGTLSHAAPELLAGKSDIRSDIYSLGVVLYEMLSGRVPFEADTPLAMMEMLRGQEPPTLGSLGVAVPPDLRAIVTRCLAKRPGERYQSPEELTAALEGRALAAAAATASGAAGKVPPSGPSGSVLAEWFKRGGSRYALLGVGIAGVALAAVIIAVAVTNGGRGEGGKLVAPFATSTPFPLAAQGPSKGPGDARVRIVEFSDFQCPYCGRFARDTLPQILSNYGDKVRFVFVNFPLSQIHENAEKAAEAGECADEQGAFWKLHDIMFQNQAALAVDNLKSYAAQLGLDTAKFNDCLDSGRMAGAVQADIQAGQKAAQGAGLDRFGTPTFFINGKHVVGAQPYEAFRQAIDAALTEANQ